MDNNISKTSAKEGNPATDTEYNASLQRELGPFINEFGVLCESVDRVHVDYSDPNYLQTKT